MKNIDLIGNVNKGTWNKVLDDDIIQVCDGKAIFGKTKVPSYLITIKKFDICITMHKTEGRGTLPDDLEGQSKRVRAWAFKKLFRAAVVDQIDCEGLIDYLESLIKEESDD